jgi:hypothetical protein
VVVALDLERDRQAVAEVEHPRVLPGTLEDTPALGRQPLQQKSRVLVAAVLRPEQREHCELEVVRIALQQFAYSLELAVREPEGAVERLFGNPRQRSESSLLRGQPAGPPKGGPARCF